MKDILIYSKDRDEHTVHLRTVLQILSEHQLYGNYQKQEFWLEEVLFLEHVVSKEGIKINLRLVTTVTKCPSPTNVTETRNFLGLARCYRVSRRICQRSSSLTNLLKEATKVARR